MKQEIKEKATIAWFKLAECVERGEKERALGLYRLLMHSVEDEPFLKKLEAELWVKFDVDKACELYDESAHLYKKQGYLREALFLYETLVNLLEEKEKLVVYLEQISLLADKLSLLEKQKEVQQKLCLVYLEQGDFQKFEACFTRLKKNLKEYKVCELYKTFIITALMKNYSEHTRIEHALKIVLKSFLLSGKEQQLQSFLESIKALNIVWYNDACTFIKTL